MIEASKKSATFALSAIIVLVCAFRFLLDGVDWTCCGIHFTFGHVDAMSYTAIMTPILASHSYLHGKDKDKAKVVKNDDPS